MAEQSPEEKQAVDLVARAGDDPAAMEELLILLQPRVMRACSKILPHPPDAEEAAQDALLTVATRLDQWSGKGSFLGWVHVVAANSARATYRTMKRRFAESSQSPRLTDDSAGANLPGNIDPRTTSVIAGSRIDLLDALEALEKARPASVEAFVLRDLGGLSYDEIAERTGAGLSAVKTRIRDAREFMREQLRVHS